VAIKVQAFDFTRYGLLHGHVRDVSRDAIVGDKRQDYSRDGGAGVNGATELVYAARIVLERPQMEIDGRVVQLLPGMAVTAEIKIGSRRIISYLLSPLTRYQQEIMRER
jgi:hemolysin D